MLRFFYIFTYYLMVMEIKYIKDHLTKGEGDTETVADGLGNYLIRCNVAVLNVKKTKTVEAEQKATTKPKAKK